MASSTGAPLQEWLVIVPDHAGALQKRIASRPKHLEGLKADREDMWLWGGMSSRTLCHLFLSSALINMTVVQS
jgi:hypothetical protein